MLGAYFYDYRNRLTNSRGVANGAFGTQAGTADYVFDALGRPIEQTETHGGGAGRTTLFSYVGLSDRVSQEQHKDAGGAVLTTKSYSYDAYGHRIALSVAPTGGAAERYTYAYDVLGSASLLLKEDGSTKAAYGYQPYGGQDESLTRGDTDATNPLNPCRYGAKRFDSGSGSYDMGARRYGPDTTRFLQPDRYQGALSDLGLSLDPLTQNRYAYAGGNPLSYVERDGHQYLDAGAGGAASDPNPSPYPTSYADVSAECGTTEVCEPTADDWDQFLDEVQVGLDVVGLVPALGEPADAANAAISAARGDETGAAASAVAVIPVVGMAGTVGKYAAKYGDEAADGMAVAVKGGNTPAAQAGNKGHYDRLTGDTGYGLPSQLQDRYVETDFQFAGRFKNESDATVINGRHPSQYPNSNWPEGADYGDFKPNTPRGERRFNAEINNGKLPAGTIPLPYDPGSGKLLDEDYFSYKVWGP